MQGRCSHGAGRRHGEKKLSYQRRACNLQRSQDTSMKPLKLTAFGARTADEARSGPWTRACPLWDWRPFAREPEPRLVAGA